MTRYLFPQDRLVFRYGSPGTPLYSPQGETLTIFANAGATTPANLQDPSGNAIDNVLEIGPDCLIPEFKGPDALTTVWAKNRAGQITALYAQTGQFLTGGGGGGAVASVNGHTGVVVLNSGDVGAYPQSEGDALETAVASAASGRLMVANNLSDLNNAGTARTNLGLGNSATRAVGTAANTVAAGDDSRITGALQKASNLSDLQSASTARTSLGLGTAATKDVGTASGDVAAGDAPAGAISVHSSATDPHGDRAAATSALAAHVAAVDPHGDRAYADGKLAKASNLSDLQSVSTARTNLGLGGAAQLSVGTGAGTVAAGNDSRITGALQAASNLSDVANAGTARTSLGLGNSATRAVGTANTDVAAGDAPAAAVSAHTGATDPHGDRAFANSTFVPLNDSRLTNARTPTAHAASHATAGSDPIAPGDIGAYTASAGTALAARVTTAENTLLRAPYRRRHLPDPIVQDSLYTGAAPSISTAQTTTPTTGYIKYAPTGVALTGSDVTGPYKFLGAGGFQIGASSPDTNYVLPTSKYPNTYASGQTTWAVEFGTDAQTIQVRMKYISTATMYRLSIDGRKVTDLMQSSGGTTAGSGHLITIDMGSAVPRRIRLDFVTFPFGGVYIPPTATMWSVAAEADRTMAFGDSLTDGSAQNTGAGYGTWFGRFARMLNSTDAWQQARGGTGYITPGAYATFANRVAADVVAWNPNRLIVWGGYNDNTGTQSVIKTAADSLYATISSGLPNCAVYVIGCWSPTGSPAASIINTDTTLRQSAAAAGFPFISPVTGSIYDASGTLVATHGPFITGSGRVGATTGTGNADLYIGTDAVHPTDAGHVYLSRRIMAAYRELLPA